MFVTTTNILMQEYILQLKNNFGQPKKAQYGNADLSKAFNGKKDEFYTQYEDIAKEMLAYKDQFRGKSVYCNCDDPDNSAFFKYFVCNFNEFGLKCLTATCLTNSYKANKKLFGARIAMITNVQDNNQINPEHNIDTNALFSLKGNLLKCLEGDGDFRSPECLAILKNADIVTTNPPFSLFREYLNLLIKTDKKFIILGNMNAVTCKDVFPLFRDNKVWYGESIKSGDRKFYIPSNYPAYASNCGIDRYGKKFVGVKGVRWFTNLNGNIPRCSIQLLHFYDPALYPRYENYNAIEVCRSKLIPADYKGIMGVPITFLDKFNPDQFEIVMLANGNARTNESRETLKAAGYIPHSEDRGGVCILDGKRSYARILIRHKK